LAIIVTRSSAMSLQARLGLPYGNQAMGWFVLVSSLAILLAYRGHTGSRPYSHRLFRFFLAFAPTFIILSISYETLFYLAFSATLYTWIELEQSVQSFHLVNLTTSKAHHQYKVDHERDSRYHLLTSPTDEAGPRTLSTRSPRYRALTPADTRISIFFFVFLQSAFFSTGNVASISSFSLESVHRLIPIFDPYSQGALLILKLMIPFALISVHLGILNQKLGVAPSALFMMVMAFSDILTLYFFWVVKDEGSWLEIGSTISHFAIASCLSIFVAALEGVTALLVVDIGVDLR
jgi:phosphatidylinositol glycan class N